MTASKFVFVAAATVLGLTACSSSSDTAPSTVTVTAPATSSAASAGPSTTTATAAEPSATNTAAPGPVCAVNPSEAPVATAEPFQWVPEVGRVSVTMSGIPSGTITPGAAPTEIDVTICNDSAVSYAEVGVVVVLGHCSCAQNPIAAPEGTVEYFDQATGGWDAVDHPVMGGGMDYLGQYTNLQELSQGDSVTIRYRIGLDASMTAGDGGVSATVVTPYPLNQIGAADMPFAVVK